MSIKKKSIKQIGKSFEKKEFINSEEVDKLIDSIKKSRKFISYKEFDDIATKISSESLLKLKKLMMEINLVKTSKPRVDTSLKESDQKKETDNSSKPYKIDFENVMISSGVKPLKKDDE